MMTSASDLLPRGVWPGDVAIDLARMNLEHAVGLQGWRSANAAVALSQLGDLLKRQVRDCRPTHRRTQTYRMRISTVPPFAPVLRCCGRGGAGEEAEDAQRGAAFLLPTQGKWDGWLHFTAYALRSYLSPVELERDQ